MKRNTILHLSLLALTLAARGVCAQPLVTVQTPPGFEVHLGDIVLPPGVELPPGFKLPGTPSKPSGTNNAAKSQSPDEKRLQELLKLKFDRSATAIISGLSAQFDSTNARTNDVEQFKQSVSLSHWKKAGDFLATLSADHGKQVYRYLLKELTSPTKPSGSPGMEMPQMMEDGQMIMVNQNQQGPAHNAAPTLIMDDVLALAEIAPHELTEGDAKLLGQLLGKLLARGDAVEPFVTKLEQGVKQIGGNKPEDRRRAAELLLGANRLTEAAVFLAPLELAKETLDWRALEQHARDLAARGKREKDSKLLLEAWDLNQFVLGITNAAATNRDPALRRCMDLLPQLSREVGTNWLRERFLASPEQGLGVFSIVNHLVQKGLTDRNQESRRKNLELQKQMVEIFLGATDPSLPHWRASLNLLAQGWLQEANWAKQRYQPPRNYGAQYDQFGNMTSYENYPQNYYDGNQIPPLTPEQVLASAPDDAWLGQVDSSLRLATMSLIADLYSKTETPDKALPFIEVVAKAQPRAGTDLANGFFRAWVTARNPNRNQMMNQARYMSGGMVYYGGSSSGMQQSGISLTRAMQVRNIKELAGLMRRFDALSLTKLDADAVVGAFAAAHSPAEVFKIEDIEAVFGQQAKIKPDTLAGLAQAMRERLAQQWRQSRVQQEAKTQRTDKQVEAEILRGYDVVRRLVDDALKLDDRNWRLHLARGSMLFDLAEFQYGKKVDLAIYVEKREESFKEFELAARLYAESLSQIEEREETPLVYQQWFNAHLGASDLAYVTRQQEPETNQLARVKRAIVALPGAAADRHLAAFAKQLNQSANTLRPELKPRYLRAALDIVGNHPDAADARKLVAYYDDLLQELELVVRVDGDATVGHGGPFGVFVTLRHTADLEREAGGFGRYLRNMKNANPYYNPYGGQQQQRNFPEEFEKQVREKLADHYDVKTITFLDDKVKSRGYGRQGWRETPLAYLLLQAKDGAVDQLPTFNMDLDFSDARGQVVLAVKSPVVLLDARPKRVPARPLDKLEIVQTLDDREIAQGRVAIEIKATANGLVPELSGLLRTNFTHLRIEEFGDRGLALNRIDAEADTLAPVSERNWQLKFTVAENAPASVEFKFPEPLSADAKVIYRRYADADLVEVKPTLALAGITLRPRPWWHWVMGGIVIAALISALVWWLGRKVHTPETIASEYSLPPQITPFVVIQLLRRMESDDALRFDEAHKGELQTTIRELEAHYFSKNRNGHAEPDLVNIGREWVGRAGNGK